MLLTIIIYPVTVVFCKPADSMVVDVSICVWESDVVVGEGVMCADVTWCWGGGEVC